MIGHIGATILLLLTGAALAAIVRVRSSVGQWYLLGLGAYGVLLQWLPWNAFVIGAVAVGSIVILARRRVRPAAWQPSLLDAATVTVIAAFAAFATLDEVWQWDAWAIWALKARLFFEHGSVDWQFLRSHADDFAHSDYPLLVPSAFALPAIITGEWDETWLSVSSIGVMIAAAVALREITARMFPARVSAAMALALTALCASRYVSTAETFFIAFAVIALACIRSGDWRSGSILLGFAAITKNEGLALLVAVAIALWLSGMRAGIRRLWPAAAIAASWLALRLLHWLPTDVISSISGPRAAANLDRAADAVTAMAANTSRPWLWLVMLLVVPLAVKRERFLATVIVVQALFCISVYVFTPYDVAWHVATSWDRITQQLACMTAFMTLCALHRLREETSLNDV